MVSSRGQDAPNFELMNSPEFSMADLFKSAQEESAKEKSLPQTTREVEFLMEKIKELEKKVKSLDEEQQ